jgi:effector-binding domain-containing protein
MNIECGVVLPHAIEDTETVRCRTTPGGLVATAVHVGDYSRLGETHRAIIEFCTRRKLPLAGVSWEIYGHWDDDPSKRFTDVFYLLTEKTKVESPKSNA